jgi:hypothetical protein
MAQESRERGSSGGTHISKGSSFVRRETYLVKRCSFQDSDVSRFTSYVLQVFYRRRSRPCGAVMPITSSCGVLEAGGAGVARCPSCLQSPHDEAPRSKLRGSLRNSPKPLPSFAKATEGSPRLHPRSKLRGIRRRRIKLWLLDARRCA